MRRFFKSERELYGVMLLTLAIMLVNYVAYYADDFIVVTMGNDAPLLLVQFFQVIAYPVHWYIEIVEKNFWLPVPILGKILNYIIESCYFFVGTSCVYMSVCWYSAYLTHAKPRTR